jgi:hypothetical protein
LHFRAPGVHVPEQAPPLHALAHVVVETHVPVSSQFFATRPSQVPVPGRHSTMQSPPTQANVHVSTRVVVTRSTPHAIESLP